MTRGNGTSKKLLDSFHDFPDIKAFRVCDTIRLRHRPAVRLVRKNIPE